MMDKVSRHLFERLVQLDPTALTEADREFLKARQSYMSPEQRLKFTTFLDEVSDGTPPVRPGTPQADYKDIANAIEADAELRAAEGTLSADHEKAIDHAFRSEKQRQAVITAATKAAEEADREAAKAAEREQKAADKAAKQAQREQKLADQDRKKAEKNAK